MAATDAQKRAMKKYREDPKNKEKLNYNKQYNAAKSFIRSKATQDDLLELMKLIQDNLK